MRQEAGGVDLDRAMGYLLKQTEAALRTAMDQVLRPVGLSVPQYACLELLAQRPGLSNAQLARGAFVSRQSTNVLLQGLERSGLVTRPAEAASGRALPAHLTARGRRTIRAASIAVYDVEARMTRGLGAADKRQLRRLLNACIAGLQS